MPESDIDDAELAAALAKAPRIVHLASALADSYAEQRHALEAAAPAASIVGSEEPSTVEALPAGSRELVVTDDGRAFLIVGQPGAYLTFACRLEHIGTFAHKWEARRTIRGRA